MKIQAVVERTMYGTINLEVPDELLDGASRQVVQRRVSKEMEKKLANEAAVEWDNVTGMTCTVEHFIKSKKIN